MTEPDSALTVVRRPSDARLAIATLVKRTYDVTPDGLEPAELQDPLVDEPLFDEDAANLLIDDSDLMAPKVATDVVVHGAVTAPEPSARVRFGIAVGEHTRTLEAIGPRHARVIADGTVRFSEPELFERLELSYRHAYGGYDEGAHDLLLPPDEETLTLMRALAEGKITDDGEFPIRAKSLFAYPRNPAGVGYFIDVDRPRADGAPLPRIEDPEDLLTAERFFVPRPPAWIAAPVAAGLGWIQHSWFPRLARFVGPLIEHDGSTRPREAELGDGADLLDMPLRDAERVFPRALQGAAPGLSVMRLRGNERFELSNLHAEHPRLVFELPGETPTVSLRPPDLKALKPDPVLQTVRIDCERLRVSLTWCAIVPLAGGVDDDYLERTELEVKISC